MSRMDREQEAAALRRVIHTADRALAQLNHGERPGRIRRMLDTLRLYREIIHREDNSLSLLAASIAPSRLPTPGLTTKPRVVDLRDRDRHYYVVPVQGVGRCEVWETHGPRPVGTTRKVTVRTPDGKQVDLDVPRDRDLDEVGPDVARRLGVPCY